MTITIIGDTNRRTSYNPNLAEKLAKQIEEEERQKGLQAKLKKKKKSEEASDKNPGVKISSNDGYITLKNIVCIDSEGKPFEQYDKIMVKKNIGIDTNNDPIKITPYEAITYFEKQNNGLFLPSLALTCNILAALYGNRVDDDIGAKVLMQYKDSGKGCRSLHAQNTIINWNTQEIIHYPKESDFPNNGGTHKINFGKQKKIGFHLTTLESQKLEIALKNKEYRKFIQNLTGLKEPEVLYYAAWTRLGPDNYLWIPSNPKNKDYVRPTWFGGLNNKLIIDTYDNCYKSYAIRGVREIK
jgi:hypothetical protein